ncbi:MAG: ABC transporter substrate-binding protein [bacterium]|nr:ABC transporter substrate-binding protein [bacterium]
MRNFKKVVAMTLIAASTASLAACGSGSSDNGKKKITLAWWGGDSRHTATKAAVEKWKATHTDFEVDLQYNSWDGYEDKMSTKFASKTQADINQINWGWLNSYDKKGDLFMDLNDSKLNGKLDLTQFDEKYLNQCKVNDKVVAVPVSITGRIFYWNMTTFKAAGIEKAPTTYEELKAAGAAFKDKLGDDYYPLALNELDRTILMVNYLESVYNKEWVVDNKLNYTEAEITEGYKFIQDLEDNHVIPNLKKLIGDGADSLDKNSNWIDGKYAGIFEWDSSAVKFQKALNKEKNPEFVVGDEIKFGENKGGYTKISLAFAISQNTKFPEECADLVNFLLNEEEGVKEMGLERGTPLSKKALSTLEAAGKLKGDMVTEANAKVISSSPFQMDPTFEDQKLKGSTGAYFTTMQNASYKTKSNEEAAKDLVTAIEAVLANNK